MKAHKSKHFRVVLQTMVLFKIYAQPYENQLSEVIKLMSTDQLYQNIMHSKFETELVKQLIIFLLSNLNNPQSNKSHSTGAVNFFKGDFVDHRKEIIQHYYTQLALSEYFYAIQDEGNHKKYADLYNFCELDTDTKFGVIETLVKNVSKSFRGKGSKSKEIDEEQSKQENKSKNTKIEQFLILGEDNKYSYFYAPFLPEYVITYYLGQWELLDKVSVIERIRKLLKQPMNTNNLFLCESLDLISSKHMKSIDRVETPIRFLAVKQNQREKADGRMRTAKKELLLINERYCRYLKNFNDQCWGYLSQRQQYIDQVQKSKSFVDLIETFKFMYECSHSKIFKCLCNDEAEVPANQQQEFYEGKTRPYCNIHTVSFAFQTGLNIKSEEITIRMIKQQDPALYPLFQFNILLLKKVMDQLEKKQQKYLRKQKKVEAASKNAEKQKFLPATNSQNSMVSSTFNKKNKGNSGMSLRPKKKQRSKKFGVTMIDSDESCSDEENFKQQSTDVNLKKYEYNTRSCIQR